MVSGNRNFASFAVIASRRRNENRVSDAKRSSSECPILRKSNPRLRTTGGRSFYLAAMWLPTNSPWDNPSWNSQVVATRLSLWRTWRSHSQGTFAITFKSPTSREHPNRANSSMLAGNSMLVKLRKRNCWTRQQNEDSSTSLMPFTSSMLVKSTRVFSRTSARGKKKAYGSPKTCSASPKHISVRTFRPK